MYSSVRVHRLTQERDQARRELAQAMDDLAALRAECDRWVKRNQELEERLALIRHAAK